MNDTVKEQTITLEDEFLGRDIQALGLLVESMSHIEDDGTMVDRKLFYHSFTLVSELLLERGQRVNNMFYEMHDEIKKAKDRV
ncbi:MAG: hypothetical protein COB17_02425 [Sulfurimonas sp.]|nr:MAG: hypothetical protein COB17_02425 [Sulfurimonas sp.]